jgi:hypothetical protein
MRVLQAAVECKTSGDKEERPQISFPIKPHPAMLFKLVYRNLQYK